MVISQQTASGLTYDFAKSWPRATGQRWTGDGLTRVLRGREAILGVQPLLAELAEVCGQTGEMDNLAYFLGTRDARRKVPHLMLFGNVDGLGRSPAGGQGLTAAILLFEYRMLDSWRGSGLRLYVSGDAAGRRNLIAPAGERTALAAKTARILIEGGAQAVQIACAETLSPTARECVEPTGRATDIAAQLMGIEGPKFKAPRGRGAWSLSEKTMPLYLELGPTFDETLARIGQRTRSNLRYYRRRSEHDLGCHFLPEARITREDFLAFNTRCTYAVTAEQAGERFDAMATLSGPFLRGIRGQDGQWLALAGGRRRHGQAEIDWQMNRADLPFYSLATVLRAYLIEHEISLGSTRLYIEGGTPHPIGRSFVKERVHELTVKRDSAYVRCVTRMGPKRNYLAQTLRDDGLVWTQW